MKNIVLYLGPEGTNSHEAALLHYGKGDNELRPCFSHEEVFDRLMQENGTDKVVAIVPVENSCEGPVTQTLDLLAATPGVTIANSFTLPIHHQLLVPQHISDKSQIKCVLSHPQALGQCRRKLLAYLPDIEQLSASSTAAAAKRINEIEGCAAIASATAAKLNNLRVLSDNIQDSTTNITRFFTIVPSRAQLTYPANKESSQLRSLIYLVIGDRPGALLHALSPFDASGVNLTFIQSRPLTGRPWEYGFFIEAVTDWQAPAAEAAWCLVLTLAESGRKIGTYPVTPYTDQSSAKL